MGFYCRGCATLYDETQRLESQLADRHAERVHEIDAHTERVAELEAEIERLRADLVWAVRHQAALYHDTPVKHVCFWIDEGWRKSDEVECDGTPDSICRAVREARDGRGDG